jgi:hypothetical protein
MTIFILIVSFFVGAGVAELAFLGLSGHWLRNKLKEVRFYLGEFLRAKEDEVREPLIICAGKSALHLGLISLLFLLGLTAFVLMPLWIMQLKGGYLTSYIVSLSVSASLWWGGRLFFLKRKFSFLFSMLSRTANKYQHVYGNLERWLHWLALEPAAVRHLAFELERRFFLPRSNNSLIRLNYLNHPTHDVEGAVYVCGLARSGTTLLLRILDEIDSFHSLSYRAMPFVLAPNLWSRITSLMTQHIDLAERVHGDGIKVDLDSPEGFEEVFWRTFGKQTLSARCHGYIDPTIEVLSDFEDYRTLVINARKETSVANRVSRRYLSKNNNNLLRLASLGADPASTILLVYRDPIATARSLFKIHQHFCVAQSEDRFMRTYMGWLSHYEFGLDHLPFCFALQKMDSSLNPDDPNYWLDYWCAVYDYVLTQKRLRFFLINHDLLRADPINSLDKIFTTLHVQADAALLAQQIAPPLAYIADNEMHCFSSELLSRTMTIYRALSLCPNNILHPEGIIN